MRKNVKLIVFLTALVIGFLYIPAIAENNTSEYYLSDIGITISLPDSFIILVKNTPVNSEELELLGMTQEEVDLFFDSNNVSLYGFSTEKDLQVNIIMGESPTSSFKKYSDEELEKYRDFLLPIIEEVHKCKVTGNAVYHHEDVPFIFYWIEGEETPYFGIDCLTDFDMKYIQIIFTTQTESFSYYDTLMVREIIDGIVFPKNASLKDVTSNTSQYHNEECKVTFDIPQGWEQQPFNKEREYLEARFGLTKDDGFSTLIMFGIEDMWNALSVEEIKEMMLTGKTRKNIDNSYFSIEEIIQETGIYNVKEIKYGKYPFFVLESEETTSKYGLTFTMYYRRAICIHNGYMLNFMYCSTDENFSSYNGFEEMLRSVSFIE